jgi:hypothetical protein
VRRVALRLTRRCWSRYFLYAYARGNRSSRQIERACWEDVAYTVITSMRVPDHSTIAEFRRRHETEIAELFDQVLGLCKEAGLVSVGVIMIDGTRIKANASMDQNRSYSGVVREILREAEETDRREDELYGDARGDELPEQLRTAEGRKAALEDAKRRIEERKGRPVGPREPEQDVEMDPELVLGRGGRRGGRREWPRVARRELESRRKSQAEPIPRDREDRLFQALARLEENHRVDLAANDAYERRRRGSRDTLGRVMKGYSKPYTPPTLPDGTINLSDPDSRVMRSKGLPHRQAYNVQTAVTEQQIILAAEISLEAADFGQLEAMLDQTLLTCPVTASPSSPRRSSVTPATGIPARSRRSRIVGSRCSSRPTAQPARENVPAGRTGSSSRCAKSSRRTAVAPSMRCTRSRSSRCSGRSNTTGASITSCEEAEPPCTRSYGWWQRPTTCTSSTTTGPPTPPEAARVATDTARCFAEHPPRQESRSFRIFRRPGGEPVVRCATDEQ